MRNRTAPGASDAGAKSAGVAQDNVGAGNRVPFLIDHPTAHLDTAFQRELDGVDAFAHFDRLGRGAQARTERPDLPRAERCAIEVELAPGAGTGAAAFPVDLDRGVGHPGAVLVDDSALHFAMLQLAQHDAHAFLDLTRFDVDLDRRVAARFVAGSLRRETPDPGAKRRELELTVAVAARGEWLRRCDGVSGDVRLRHRSAVLVHHASAHRPPPLEHEPHRLLGGPSHAGAHADT